MKANDYKGPWPWKNFAPIEIGCRHCGELWKGEKMPEYFRDGMTKLQALREAWGKPIIVNSGHRCNFHNQLIGGAKNSQHLKLALDCRCPMEEQEAFCKLALEMGFTVARPYPEDGFVHLDMGKPRTW